MSGKSFIGGLVAGVAIAGLSVVGASGSSITFNACVNKSSGLFRMASSSRPCTASENPVTWTSGGGGGGDVGGLSITVITDSTELPSNPTTGDAYLSEEGILSVWNGTAWDIVVLKGDDGEQGLKGDKGDTGEQGLKGDKGDTGEQGLKGDTGDTGEQGLKGDTGDTGEQGLKGDTGEQGLKGDKGDTGEQGLKGDKGDTGSVGPSGILAATESNLVDDVAMSSNGTWYNGPTLTLGAGTYLVYGQVTISSPNNTNLRATVRISNSSTTFYAEGQLALAAAGGGTKGTGTVVVFSLITLSSETTLRLEAVSTAANSVLEAEVVDSSSLNDAATRLLAIKIVLPS